MRYKPELGFFGNLERAFSELNKTNNNVFNMQNTVNSTKDELFDELDAAYQEGVDSV